MECYLGMVTTFAFNFTPMYFAACNGQLLQIQQNTALYSLLGTAFGGNGTTNFNLPNLQGRTPVHAGPTHGFAQPFGQDSMTLNAANLPGHTHVASEKTVGQTVTATAAATVNASSAQGAAPNPAGNYWAKVMNAGSALTAYSTPKNATMASDAVEVSVTPTFNAANLNIASIGNGTAFSLDQPSLALNFCICTSGLYPTRT